MPTPPAPPAPPTLTDGVVTLRALEEGDVEPALEQCVDPDSIRWTQVPLEYTLEDSRWFLLERAPQVWADGSEWIFAIEFEGRYGGNLALRDEGLGRAEVAYGSHPSVRGVEVAGRSVMERACRLLLDWGFAEKDVETVIWRAEVGNWASRKLAWKLGFSVDGTLRHSLPHRGELRDGWVGTLLRGDAREPKGRWLDVPVLRGERVVLRPLTLADVPRIVQACADDRTAHWLGTLPVPYTEADAREWLALVSEWLATGARVTWAVADPASDALLGAINLFGLVPGVEGEIGYWTHPDARGTGLTSEAARLVTAHGFEAFELAVVRGVAAVENVASRRVLESVGMRLAGVERLGTRIRTGPVDAARYDVLRDEWAAR